MGWSAEPSPMALGGVAQGPKEFKKKKKKIKVRVWPLGVAELTPSPNGGSRATPRLLVVVLATLILLIGSAEPPHALFLIFSFFFFVF